MLSQTLVYRLQSSSLCLQDPRICPCSALLCGGLNEEEITTYKSYFINALEMVKDDPNITEFYLATISYNQQEPILKIFGYTKNPLAPVKPFEFRVGDNNKVLRIK